MKIYAIVCGIIGIIAVISGTLKYFNVNAEQQEYFVMFMLSGIFFILSLMFWSFPYQEDSEND